MGMLDGEIAVVTGAAQGIGNAVARELADAGARVALTTRKPEAAVRAAEDLGGEHAGVTLDVRSRPSIEAAVDEIVSRLGEPSILVNNAGINHIAPAEDVLDENWDEIIDTNLTGIFRCCQLFGRRMLKSGRGSIVNIGSIIGSVVGMPGRSPYAASKAGTVGLSKILAVEWASRGVRVNVVIPGPVRTPMVEQAIRDRIVDEDAIAMRTPAGRIAEPEDIARAVVLLASAEAGFVTGQTLVVDGGFSTYGAAGPLHAEGS